MQANSKNSTDIDRKLAIYYHPLFQEVIKITLDLFQQSSGKFEVGLLEFVEFNLKLQKALLPSFEIDNALISGLNDWVKQVAECLTYEGMVSTIGCVEVTSANVMQLIQKQYSQCTIQLFEGKQKYLETLSKVISHDAFKLLGVKINKEVFSKFMFDLCYTWCEFLDVELFSYFLIGLYIQVSEGETIEGSRFKSTNKITTIDLEFMEEFQEIKSTHAKVRRKQLRYYRAWCQWNYLRVNEAGERLILKLDELHPEDNRILQLAMVFERAIQIINEQITSQNPKAQQKKQPRKPQNTINREDQDNKDFLILKKLNIEPSQKQQAKEKQSLNNEVGSSAEEQMFSYPVSDSLAVPQQFEIEIDELGNMYLKRIVKLPVFGIKIQPRPFEERYVIFKQLIERKKNQYREVSNLYGKMDNMKIRLEHNAKNDPYTFKKLAKIQERDRFYLQPKFSGRSLDKTIHQKLIPSVSQKEQAVPQVPLIKKEDKISLRHNNQYIHKVMAPAFLTDDANNLSYAEAKQGQIYSNSANDQKRQIRIGLPKLKHMQFRVKALKSYHLVGNLANDRSLINEKVKSASLSIGNEAVTKTKLENLKDENKHIWGRYMDEEEVKQMNNYQQFYWKLQQAKRKFGLEFQSEFRVNLRPMLAYENKRYELGGYLTKEDQQRFSIRMEKLINKEDRKRGNKRRRRKEQLRQYRRNFKNKKEKSLYQDIFINYHKQAIQELRIERKRHASMIAN